MRRVPQADRRRLVKRKFWRQDEEKLEQNMFKKKPKEEVGHTGAKSGVKRKVKCFN